MIFPRVLIVGETFRLNGGGGITMMHLFKDWPDENIGVVTDNIAETNPSTHYSYYQLGHEEIKFPFPFYFFQAHFHSGPYHFPNNGEALSLTLIDRDKKFNPKKIIRPLFDRFLKLTGLFSSFYNIKLSQTLKEWIIGFKPDIIYVQPFRHNIMRFGNLLYKELGLPYAIHIMDDSVKYINHSIILKGKWQNIIERDFKKLVVNAKVRMCISEAMAYEYQQRYGCVFLSFRNPIEIENWLPSQKKNFTAGPDTLKIIYTGRLFSPTFHALVDLCKVIDRFNKESRKISLDIYTYDKNASFFRKINNLKGITMHNPVNVREIPMLIRQYDIFFLCLDFDKKAQKYSQFSISTRTSESMISAVPVLIYAPSTSAQYKYFEKTNSGCLVGERDSQLLNTAILKLWNNSDYREQLSKNAVKTALLDSDALIVRENFRKALIFS
jgi:glycosyltransferase involved in cell wall biosynthesis